MPTATTLLESARPFLTASINQSRTVKDVDTGLLLGLYAAKIEEVTEPGFVLGKVKKFFQWPLLSEARRDDAMKLNHRLDRLSFNYHMGGTRSVSARMRELEAKLLPTMQQDYRQQPTEKLYQEAGEISQQVKEAHGIQFYPLNVRESMFKAATLLRHMEEFNSFAHEMRFEREASFNANCARHYTSLFRVTAKILLTDTEDGANR